MENSRLFLQSVGLIHNDTVEQICWRIPKGIRGLKQALNVAELIFLPPEFLEIYVSGGGILCNIVCAISFCN